MTLRAVPDRQDPDVYGHIDLFDGVNTRRLSIAVSYNLETIGRPEDVLLSPNGWVLKHPFEACRMSTEEERAAVGWTW